MVFILESGWLHLLGVENDAFTVAVIDHLTTKTTEFIPEKVPMRRQKESGTSGIWAKGEVFHFSTPLMILVRGRLMSLLQNAMTPSPRRNRGRETL
jgi:hypothetical protein